LSRRHHDHTQRGERQDSHPLTGARSGAAPHSLSRVVAATPREIHLLICDDPDIHVLRGGDLL
jgi:hypothetical protein